MALLHSYMINKDLFLSPDYRKITDIGHKLKDLIKSGAYIQRDEKKQPINSFSQVMIWLMAKLKKVRQFNDIKD